VEIACTDKAQVPATIQQVMEAASYEVMERECEFQVTTSLATKITLLQQWKLMDLDDLASGLTPFLLARGPHKNAKHNKN